VTRRNNNRQSDDQKNINSQFDEILTIKKSEECQQQIKRSQETSTANQEIQRKINSQPRDPK